jgi:hypothetical protein
LAGGKRVARLFNIQTYWQIQKVLFPVAFWVGDSPLVIHHRRTFTSLRIIWCLLFYANIQNALVLGVSASFVLWTETPCKMLNSTLPS